MGGTPPLLYKGLKVDKENTSNGLSTISLGTLLLTAQKSDITKPSQHALNSTLSYTCLKSFLQCDLSKEP